MITQGLGSSTLITRGLDGADAIGVSAIVPSTGTILGGTEFSIQASGISAGEYSDNFTDTMLDAKWTNISTGGSILVGDGLKLLVPSTGGMAGIKSSAALRNFDISIACRFDYNLELYRPTSSITLYSILARINPSSSIGAVGKWDPSSNSIIVNVVLEEGTTVTTLSSIQVTEAIRLLRIVRIGGRVLLQVDKTLTEVSGWHEVDASIEISASAPAIPIGFSTTISSIVHGIIVTFNDGIADRVALSDSRISGVSPPGRLPTEVQVVVHTTTDSLVASGTYTYIAANQLTIVQQQINPSGKVTIVIDNDKVLRD